VKFLINNSKKIYTDGSTRRSTIKLRGSEIFNPIYLVGPPHSTPF